MAALGTCMTAVYRAAGGTVNASGVPTTKGSSYNPKLANAAMVVVKKQYNAVQDAAQKRDVQQAAARTQAAVNGPDKTVLGTAIGVGKGLLSLIDGAANYLPDQIAQQGSRPRAPLWHSDLAGSFASWADRQVGITDGSVASVEQNATSVGTQIASLFIPGIDEADAAAITARITEISDDTSIVTKTPEAGSVNYGALDSLGRPTGVDANLTPDMVGTGTPASRSISPPGFAGGAAGQARGHLLGRQLGGSGTDPRNLVTIFQNPANTPIMSGLEGQVRAALEAGQVVDYSATPVYTGSDLVPAGITLRAQGSGGLDFFLTGAQQGTLA